MAKITQQRPEKSGIYGLKCHPCNITYIAQTGGERKTHFNKHRRYIRTDNVRQAYVKQIINTSRGL
jgi:hypothetical protein